MRNIEADDLKTILARHLEWLKGNAEGERADLSRADLSRANLSGANLSGANLSDAQWILQGAVRSDGYAFFFQQLTADASPMIKAGCRYFTLADARAHWTATRAGTPLGDETFAILDNLEALAHIRGYLKA